MAPFTWEGGTDGVREVIIKGLKIELAGKLYDEAANDWVHVGLFELKPVQCTLNMTVTGAEIGALQPGIRQTRGTISINGRSLQ